MAKLTRDEIKQQALDKKKALLEKAKAKQEAIIQKTVMEKPRVTKVASDDSKTISKLNRRIQELEKANRQSEKLLREEKQKNHDLRLINREIRQETEGKDVELSEIQAAIAFAEQYVDDRNHRVDQFLKHAGRSYDQFLSEEFAYEKEQVARQQMAFRVPSRIRELEGELEEANRLLSKRDDAKRQLAAVQRNTNKRQGVVKQLKQQVQQLQSEVTVLKHMLKNQKTTFDPSQAKTWDLVKVVEGRLEKADTLDEFDGLNFLFSQYYDKFHELWKSQSTKFIYGLASQVDEGHWLVTEYNSGIAYPLELEKPNRWLEEGSIVKARLYEDQGYATLKFVLDAISEKAMIRRDKVIKQVKTKDKTKAPGLLDGVENSVSEKMKNLSVQIVTANYGQKYVDALRPYVKRVEINDPYEKDVNRIFSGFDSYDFSLIFTDGVPHSVTDYLKTQDVDYRRVQVFYNAQSRDVVARLYYLMIQDEMTED